MNQVINFAVVGSSWIAKQFCDACDDTNNKKSIDGVLLSFAGVCATSEEKAKKFAEEIQNKKQNVSDNLVCTKNIEDILQNNEINLVYVATPNALHFEIAQKCLESQKNVIVEKPIVPAYFTQKNSIKQLKKLHETAQKNNVYVFEAMRSIWDENLISLKKYLEKQTEEITGANIIMQNYSSKLNEFNAGKDFPVFSFELAGGALNDFGVYVLYAACYLFGEPKSAAYFPNKLRSKVDGSGIILLKYDKFYVNITISKTQQSLNNCEIYLKTKTITIDNITLYNKIRVFNIGENKAPGFHDKEQADEGEKIGTTKNPENPLLQEVIGFTKIITGKNTEHNYKDLKRLSLSVCKVMNKIQT